MEEGLRDGRLIDGRYRIGREIGRGAMGLVYEAQHMRLDRRVAVKVLLEELASDREACERFEREARAAARIGSQHIVDVHDVGECAGTRYMVMEYLRGETLKDYFARLAPLTPEDLLPLIAQLLDGLAAAHDAGIVHRDVKPENIFLVEDEDDELAVKILDFGVSKFRDVGTAALKSRTGVVLGTPHYMAPEQARGLRDVDRRADVFAAGVVLYEGLSGHRPFAADNVNQLLFSIALDDAPRLADRVPGIDPGLDAIVAKATQRNPDRRYQSARQFADDVRAWLYGDELDAMSSLTFDAAPPLEEAAPAPSPDEATTAPSFAETTPSLRARLVLPAALATLTGGGIALGVGLVGQPTAASLGTSFPVVSPVLPAVPASAVTTAAPNASAPPPAVRSPAPPSTSAPPPSRPTPSPPVPRRTKTPRPIRRDL